MSSLSGTSHTAFQELSEKRLREAQALLGLAEYDGAYYLAGYAAECALKAVITKSLPAATLPPLKLIKDVYVHKLDDLLKLSGLKGRLEADDKVFPGLMASWTVVSAWSEEKRYYNGTSQQEAEDLLTALADPQRGIIQWLKQNW